MSNESDRDLIETLGDALSPEALGALAGQLGISADDATKLVRATVPALLQQLERNAESGDGETIAKAVAEDHDGSVLDDAVGFLGGGFLASSGGGVLAHAFGDQIDATAERISAETHLPEAAVRAAMTALAPMAMGAIAKVAVGAVTAAGVAAILGMAVQGIRSGKVQRVIGNINDRFDDDRDGNALDDVGRDAVAAAKGARGAVAGAARTVARNPTVRAQAGRARTVATNAATGAKRKLKKLFGRFGKRG